MNTLGIRRHWEIAPHDDGRVQDLARELSIPPIVAQLLILRGQDTAEKATLFLRPSIKHLSDPFLLTDLDVAVARITEARDRGEHVLVFGDYDVDGISGTAILVNGLKRFGIEQVSYNMPKRLTEGYGLAPEHVDEAIESGVSLLVTVDNGISAHEAANHAKARGLDLIVTDHHAIEGDLPEALAVVNPQREPEDYVGRHLCGAGTAPGASSPPLRTRQH